MISPFDTPIDRRGTISQKWDKYAGRDVLPMWVADMDFRSPEPVIEALRRRVEHGIFGYTVPHAPHTAEVAASLHKLHSWRIDPEWIVWIPGVNVGMNLACSAIGGDQSGAVTLTPVYPPFFTAPTNSGRPLVRVPLVRGGQGRYSIDFEALSQAGDDNTRMLLLCSPHNPVGRVWTREELTRIAEIALRRGWTIVSDEIHCGLVLEGEHLPTAALGKEVEQATITLLAPSKTYNLPGLTCAIAVIPDPELRRRFVAAKRGKVGDYNVIGMIAAHAAWTQGEPWRQELITYLRGNRDHLLDRVRREVPQLGTTPVEATYLAWFDARPLGLDQPAAWLEKHGLGVNEGSTFGAPGHFRLNFGCTRALLDQGIDRLARALGRP